MYASIPFTKGNRKQTKKSERHYLAFPVTYFKWLRGRNVHMDMFPSVFLVLWKLFNNLIERIMHLKCAHSKETWSFKDKQALHFTHWTKVTLMYLGNMNIFLPLLNVCALSSKNKSVFCPLCLQDGYYFSRDGKWTLVWLHFAHNFSNFTIPVFVRYIKHTHEGGWMDLHNLW